MTPFDITRRALLGGMAGAAMPVAAVATQSEREAQGNSVSFDEAVLYLAGRVALEAETMLTAGPNKSEASFRRLDACARAMAVLPAQSASAVEAKRNVASWEWDTGRYVMSLAGDVRAALVKPVAH